MAQVTNTYSTYDSVGQREDLTDIIYSISPTDTPFMSSIGKEKATAVLHEWQTDALAAAAADNYQIEGDEIAFTAPTATVRLNNRTQISRKSVIVSGTQDAVNLAGRNNELAYQISKNSKELKRDMETSLTANQAPVTGNDTTPRRLGGIECWIKTNTSKGGGSAADPTTSGSNARTDGTQRAFTESQLKDVVKKCWDEGGDPNMVMLGSFNKQKLSGFTGGSTRFDPAENKRLVAAVDIYESDFGALTVVPNRFSRARSAYVIQPDMWGVAFLRDFQLVDLAKSGDAEKKAMLCEYTLVSKNEKASGGIFDLTTA
nr:phage major head protein [uncultured Mediterranean phage uvMED]BAR31633.1 phage major head protein [uncultured Mediterranean phage uvMED]